MAKQEQQERDYDELHNRTMKAIDIVRAEINLKINELEKEMLSLRDEYRSKDERLRLVVTNNYADELCLAEQHRAAHDEWVRQSDLITARMDGIRIAREAAVDATMLFCAGCFK